MPLKAGLFYRFGPYRLDAEQRLLWNRDELVPLTLKALEALLALVENPGRLVGKDELMKRLWPDTFVEENNLAFNISVLRKALTDGQGGFAYIETIPRRGYRFVAPVVTEISPGIPNPEAAESRATPPAETVVVTAHGPNGTALQDAAARLATVLGPNVDASRQGYSQGAPPQTAAPESPHLGVKARKKLWFTVAAVAGVSAALAGCGWLQVRPLPSPTVHNPKQLINDGLAKGQLATDGERLYFTERASTGELVLKQMSVNGGELSSIPSPAGDLGVSDVSPDYSSLLLGRVVGADTPIWLLPLPGGSPRRLGNLVGHDASWSPDGHRIAYCSGHGLYVANQDGSEPRRIAASQGEVSRPRWLPNGTLLRFTENSPPGVASQSVLWEVLPDGAGLHPLLQDWNDPPRERRGSWTPDGKYFVFESEKGGKTNIWAIREKGGGFHRRSREPMKLTDLPQRCYDPILSLDGKRIFFLGRTERGRLEHFSQVEKQFVAILDGTSAEWVAYSPDGVWVAFVKYPDSTLWCMRRDGSEARQLAFSPMKVQGLAWSPDGQQIAFNAWTAANPFKNYLVAAKGEEEPSELQRGHTEMEGIPSWSPDGRKIAFGDVPEEFGHANKENVIHILDLLTRKSEILPHSEGFWSPRWSPDGRYVAALRDDDPDRYRQPLWLYDLKTERWQDLHVDRVGDMVWSHDGRYIYYGGEPGSEGFFRVRVPNGRPQPVANTSEIMRVNEGWLGLTPTDSPMILRDAGGEEIYSVDVDWR